MSGTPIRWFAHVAAVDPSDKTKMLEPPYIVAPWMSSTETAGGEVLLEADTCIPVLRADRRYESDGVFGPAVTFFKGCWIMVYVSGIPTAV